MNNILMKSNLQQKIILLYFGLKYFVNFSLDFKAAKNQYFVAMINLTIQDMTLYYYYIKKENKD